ncbi:MAG: hypothetical protein KIT46_01500 [Anaerolineales bacterium]|nr:hypothetical protein [Anaerolineales bacterium]MCW5854699.1 hypothetical protein [Anaerolineales bacterium]
MPIQNVLLIIGITVLAAIAINLFLLALHRPGKLNEFHFFSRLANVARNPWKGEDDRLSELSRRVQALRAGDEEDSEA